MSWQDWKILEEQNHRATEAAQTGVFVFVSFLLLDSRYLSHVPQWHTGEACLACILSFSLLPESKRHFTESQYTEKETACTEDWTNLCIAWHTLFIICLNTARSTTELCIYSRGYRRKRLMQHESTIVKECCISGPSFWCLCELQTQLFLKQAVTCEWTVSN